MSRSQRRAMIDREEPNLSLVRQCALLGISRSSLYYLPTEAGAEDLELMALIDQQYLKTPFYGSRRMTAWLSNHGHQVNRKRVRRLMQLIGLEAIYRRPNTSKPNPGHKVYPYLLRGLEINRVNQVWATDITSRVPGSGVRGRGSGERETTASSLAGKEESSRKEDNSGQGKDGPAGAIAQGGNGR